MAEVLANQHRQKAGVAKAKKISLRVDLTPMVDLGFLLISFFIFTTTLSKPAIMKLVLPDDRKNIDLSLAPENKTLHLILGANHQAYTYNGLQVSDIKSTVGTNGIRDAILQKKNELRTHYGSDSGMIILIKPTIASTYKDVVNALDEMLICSIKTYVLMDADAVESKAIQSFIPVL